MSVIAAHRTYCERQHGLLEARLSKRQSAGRRHHTQVTILANRYGTNPGKRFAGLLSTSGEVRSKDKVPVIDHAPSFHRTHTLNPLSGDPAEAVRSLMDPTDGERRTRAYAGTEAEWRAACLKTARVRLNREINGRKRALWLYLLWSGADVRQLRPTFYHWDEFMSLERWTGLGRPAAGWPDYWSLAYRMMKPTFTLSNVLAYTAGLLTAWDATGDSTHSGTAFLEAAQRLILAQSGEVAA